MKVIRFNTTYFETIPGGDSMPKFVAGEYYPVTDETMHHVGTGIAEEVDAADDVVVAMAFAAKLQAKAENATAAAHDATVAADAAQAAQVIADQRAALQADIDSLGAQIEAADDTTRPALQAQLTAKQSALAALGEPAQ